jgi:hypothetical protein
LEEGTLVVVLVEGDSDRGAVEALALRLGHDPSDGDTIVVSMGGVTNVGHFLRLYRQADKIAILCDVGEVSYVHEAVERHPDEVGVFACDVDLEDELIRAVGLDWMLDFIHRQGELATFHTMQKQPDQRERTLHQQLHRFMGIKSGRKVRYATDLGAQIPIEFVPEPLERLLLHVFEG